MTLRLCATRKRLVLELPLIRSRRLGNVALRPGPMSVKLSVRARTLACPKLAAVRKLEIEKAPFGAFSVTASCKETVIACSGELQVGFVKVCLLGHLLEL